MELFMLPVRGAPVSYLGDAVFDLQLAEAHALDAGNAVKAAQHIGHRREDWLCHHHQLAA